MSLSRFFSITPRTLRRGAVIGLLAALALAAQTVLGPSAHADGPPRTQRVVVGGELRITTDRQQYQVGDPIRICFTVPGAGYVAIYDWQGGGPEGRRLVAGYDRGDGGCFWGTVTPPLGYEYLQIKFLDHSGQLRQAWSDAFLVQGAVPI